MNPEDKVIDEIGKLVDWQLEQGERGDNTFGIDLRDHDIEAAFIVALGLHHDV
jgi:hypothetical protein